MKKILTICILAIGLNTSINAQVKADTIKNETVMKMTKAKLGDKIILSKINTSPTKFDISTDALIKLKENNVSDTIVNLMVYKQSLQEEATEIKDSKNGDGAGYTFKESGIYFKKDGKYIPLDPTIVTSTTAKGALYTQKFLAQIEGREANYQINSTSEFYFNFEPAKKDLNKSNNNTTAQDNYMQQILNGYGYGTTNATAVSPNEFKLVKLDVSKSKREYMKGKFSTFTGKQDFSIDDKYIVTFKYEKVSENTYKVTFPNALKTGEYCFVYLSNSANINPYFQVYGQNNTKVFDFGVK
jgi:hypothetical protein